MKISASPMTQLASEWEASGNVHQPSWENWGLGNLEIQDTPGNIKQPELLNDHLSKSIKKSNECWLLKRQKKGNCGEP